MCPTDDATTICTVPIQSYLAAARGSRPRLRLCDSRKAKVLFRLAQMNITPSDDLASDDEAVTVLKMATGLDADFGSPAANQMVTRRLRERAKSFVQLACKSGAIVQLSGGSYMWDPEIKRRYFTNLDTVLKWLSMHTGKGAQLHHDSEISEAPESPSDLDTGEQARRDLATAIQDVHRLSSMSPMHSSMVQSALHSALPPLPPTPEGIPPQVQSATPQSQTHGGSSGGPWDQAVPRVTPVLGAAEKRPLAAPAPSAVLAPRMHQASVSPASPLMKGPGMSDRGAGLTDRFPAMPPYRGSILEDPAVSELLKIPTASSPDSIKAHGGGRGVEPDSVIPNDLQNPFTVRRPAGPSPSSSSAKTAIQLPTASPTVESGLSGTLNSFQSAPVSSARNNFRQRGREDGLHRSRIAHTTTFLEDELRLLSAKMKQLHLLSTRAAKYREEEQRLEEIARRLERDQRQVSEARMHLLQELPALSATLDATLVEVEGVSDRAAALLAELRNVMEWGSHEGGAGHEDEGL